jgi:hypothetical protein
MIVWSGVGFLVAVFGYIWCVVMEFAVEAWFQNDLYYQRNGWPKLLALSIAACMVWPLGRMLNRRPEDSFIVDSATGELKPIPYYAPHTFFFIPMEHWAPILVFLGIVMAAI